MAIQWISPTNPHKMIQDPFGKQGTTVVDLDLAKLEAIWSTKKDFYVGENGSGAGDKERWRAIKGFVDAGERLEMPVLFTANGKASSFQFVDGRHRTAVARDIGEKRAMFIVPSPQAALFTSAFA